MEKQDASRSLPAQEVQANSDDSGEGQTYMSKDEAHLASLGYKQGRPALHEYRYAGN